MPTALPPIRIAAVVCFAIISIASLAQTTSVKFRVVDKTNNKPIAFAAIKAIPIDDTLHPLQKLADSLGNCTIKLTIGKQYKIQATALNYKMVEKGITTKGTEQSFALVAEPSASDIGNVTVRTTKPLMRQEDDKTIVEPEALAAASTNAYEILEKTPGVFLDQDGNVYLSSATPSQIYINGREMKMSTADIATMLKNLPPNAVAKIEIIRSPSAKYDASGTGGIINIVLKKGFKPGMTGSVTAAMQQGTYGNQFIGFSLNNNNGKTTSYLNLNYGRRNFDETIISDRLLTNGDILHQNANTKYQSPNYFAGYGFTNALSKNFDLDFSGNTSYSDINNSTENLSTVHKGSVVTSNNLNKVHNKGSNFYTGNGLNGKLKIDTSGSEWETNFWYSYSSSHTRQDISNTSFYQGSGDNQTRRNFTVVKSDLKLKLKNKFTFETGFRSSFLSFKSVAEYYLENATANNTFRYNENINAAYLQGSKTFGKDFVVKFGVRGEYTNMTGHQMIPKDTTYKLNRTDFFPYVYLSKKVMAISGFELRAYLVYRRTLNRPSYDQLNPFVRPIDKFLVEIGNPNLRPQFTHNYEANISVDERPILAVGFNQTKDIFTNVTYPYKDSVLRRTYDNLGSNKEVYFRALGAIPPGGKYFFVLGAQYSHNFYEGLYNNKPLSYKRGTWTLFTYHQLKLGKLSQFTLNGFVRFKGLQQFYELGPFGSLNATINRQFFNQKLVVTLSMNDMFFTNKNDFIINQSDIIASGNRFSDTRRFGINIRYNFGIKKKEDTNMFNVDAPTN